MKDITISADHLTKIYTMYANERERYLDFFLPRPFGQRFCALQDVSFSLEAGQSLGLLGWNGSGKSTLVNLLSGASSPSGGTVQTSGRVSLLSIGTGILPSMTGLENITQKCLLQGFSPADIQRLTPEIVAFSELGEFIHQPVRTYSSGMRSKLGFAVASCIDPDILMIDEALSVGDATFAQKCLQRMNRFREQRKTIVFVSHSAQHIRDFCDMALWLEGGKVRAFGPCQEVLTAYVQFLQDFQALSPEAQRQYKDTLRAKQFLTV